MRAPKSSPGPLSIFFFLFPFLHSTARAHAESRIMAAGLKVPEMALRLCVVPLSLASLWEMATNAQADDTYGEVKFSDLSGFRSVKSIHPPPPASIASVVYLDRPSSSKHYN